MGQHHTRAGARDSGRRDRSRVCLCRYRCSHTDSRFAGEGGEATRRHGTDLLLAGDGASNTKPRPAGDCRYGNFGRRFGVVGFKGPTPQASLGHSAGNGAGIGANLWQRWFYLVFRKQLQAQLAGWLEQGIPRVKMKIGRDAQADPGRVRAARQAIGPETELFVDANGAYRRKQALAQAEKFVALNVKWFEEPVSSDDLPGLRLVRDRAPAVMEIAAGEYGYEPGYFRRMLAAGAVDVLQADATRCGGITVFLQIAALCEAFHLDLSAHTAPALHTHVCCAAVPLRHLEYFHDHVRIEQMFFDGISPPMNGRLMPDLSRPGMGIELKHADAQRFAA